MFFYSQKKIITDENGHFDWSKIDSIAARVIKSFKYTPAIGDAGITFDDPDESQLQSQKQRQTRKKCEMAMETKPMSLTQQQMSGRDVGTKKLRDIWQQIKMVKFSFSFLTIDSILFVYRSQYDLIILFHLQFYEKNNNEPIPYYRLIIDPDNMMNTFDNAFQLSFLFRDGSIGFEYDKHQMPAIRTVSDDRQKKQSNENKQFLAKLNSKIISVSMALCRTLTCQNLTSCITYSHVSESN